MANWGIGLGGLAQGIDRGIGIMDKLNGTPEEQRQRRVQQANDEAKTEFDANGGGSIEDFQQKYLLPKVSAKMVAAGDLQGAKEWQSWATDENNRRATKDFGTGMIAAQAGDMEGALKSFVKAGNTKGYGGDYQFSDPQPIEGGGFAVNLTTKNGQQITKQFKTPDDVLKIGATYFNPEAAFADWRSKQADTTKRANDLADDATKYGARTAIDTKAEQDRVPIDTAKYSGRKGVDVATAKEMVPIEVDKHGQEKRIDDSFDALKGDREVANDATKYGARTKINAGDREAATTDALERHQGTKQIDLAIERQKNELGLNGTREHDPADVKTAQWLMDKKIAKDPADAWNMVRRSRDNPDQIRATIFSRALTPSQGQKNWEAYLKAGQQPATPAPGLGGGNPAPAPRPVQPAPDRPDMMTPGNGTKPQALNLPPPPANVPPGSGYSPGTGMWFARDGRRWDKNGNPVAAQ